MFIHNLNPAILEIGPLSIRWYGLFYIIGFLFGMWYFRKFSDLSKEQVYDFFTYLILGGILGGRLGYVLIYNLSFYLSNPLQIFAVWNGGMSFHGGLLGAVIAGLYFSNKNKISFYKLADLTVIPLALGLALGRLGNFINGELYGIKSTISWCFDFGDGECRHPSQIYESLKNLFSAFILFLISKKSNLKEGTLFWTFWILYGGLRFSIEFVRYSEVRYFGWLSTGQILSGLMFLIGIFMLFYINKKKVSKL